MTLLETYGKLDDAAVVKIGGDRIRLEALLDGRHRVAEPEACCAVAHVKDDDFLLARFHHDGVEFAVGKDDGKLLREDVGVNVTGPHMLEDEIGIGPSGAREKVDIIGTLAKRPQATARSTPSHG